MDAERPISVEHEHAVSEHSGAEICRGPIECDYLSRSLEKALSFLFEPERQGVEGGRWRPAVEDRHVNVAPGSIISSAEAAEEPSGDEVGIRVVGEELGQALENAGAVHVGAQSAPASRVMASRSVWHPAARSSGVAFSISLWLMPSSQGTKIIPVGATRAT